MHRFPNAKAEIAFGNLTKVRHDFCHPKIMPVTDAEFLMKFGILFNWGNEMLSFNSYILRLILLWQCFFLRNAKCKNAVLKGCMDIFLGYIVSYIEAS